MRYVAKDNRLACYLPFEERSAHDQKANNSATRPDLETERQRPTGAAVFGHDAARSPSRMRILAVQETDWVERNPIMHHRILEALSRGGDDVRVIDFDINWRAKSWRPIVKTRSVVRGHHKFYADASITLIRPAMLRIPGLGRISWLASCWREITAVLHELKPDVVVAYGISNALLSYYLARRASIPFVYHVLDALHTLAEPAPLRPIARRVEQMVMRRADRVVVINHSLRDYAVAMGASPERVDVVPVGWARPTLPPGAAEEERRDLGVGEADFLLLFVGWLYEFSGLCEVAAELSRRRAELPQVKCAIVGDGDLLSELQRLASGTDLKGRLLVLGRRPHAEIPALIAAADACLLPARRVPAMEHIVPAKMGEYMELRKPVIATRLPGLEAEFGALPGVLYVERPEEVLDRVDELLSDARGGREAARQLGETCRRFATARGDWDTVTARFRTILLGTLNGRG
jgi:glycosyltransferase involved in cell wall biosynthesis